MTIHEPRTPERVIMDTLRDIRTRITSDSNIADLIVRNLHLSGFVIEDYLAPRRDPDGQRTPERSP